MNFPTKKLLLCIPNPPISIRGYKTKFVHKPLFNKVYAIYIFLSMGSTNTLFFLGLRPNPVSHPKQLANLTDCKHLDNKFFSMLHLHYSVHPPLITSRALHLIRSVREKIFSSCIRNVYNRYLRCFAYYVKPYQNKNI